MPSWYSPAADTRNIQVMDMEQQKSICGKIFSEPTQLILFYQNKNTTYQISTVCPRRSIKEFWRVAWWKETMISNQYTKKTSDSSGFTITVLNLCPCRIRVVQFTHWVAATKVNMGIQYWHTRVVSDVCTADTFQCPSGWNYSGYYCLVSLLLNIWWQGETIRQKILHDVSVVLFLRVKLPVVNLCEAMTGISFLHNAQYSKFL